MGVNNNRFLNTIPREKFGLSAGIQPDNISLIILTLQISCKILAVAKIFLYNNFKCLKILMLKRRVFFKEVQGELCNLFHRGQGSKKSKPFY